MGIGIFGKDVEILNKIKLFKKIRLTITEIKDWFDRSIQPRRKEQELER